MTLSLSLGESGPPPCSPLPSIKVKQVSLADLQKKALFYSGLLLKGIVRMLLNGAETYRKRDRVTEEEREWEKGRDREVGGGYKT